VLMIMMVGIVRSLGISCRGCRLVIGVILVRWLVVGIRVVIR